MLMYSTVHLLGAGMLGRGERQHSMVVRAKAQAHLCKIYMTYYHFNVQSFENSSRSDADLNIQGCYSVVVTLGIHFFYS